MTEDTADGGGQGEVVQTPSDSGTVQESNDLVGFFIIGAVVNVALLAAYMAWAFRQWRNRDR